MRFLFTFLGILFFSSQAFAATYTTELGNNRICLIGQSTEINCNTHISEDTSLSFTGELSAPNGGYAKIGFDTSDGLYVEDFIPLEDDSFLSASRGFFELDNLTFSLIGSERFTSVKLGMWTDSYFSGEYFREVNQTGSSFSISSLIAEMGNWEDSCGDFRCDGFSVLSFTTEHISAVPLPAALPLYAAGMGLLGVFWRRRKMIA